MVAPALRILLIVKVPSILNHLLEVLIGVDRDGDVVVVLDEFLQSQVAVAGITILNKFFISDR